METKLSVRNLVEFLMQDGDINSGFTTVDRALLGSRIHRKLQKSGGDGYESEVFLSYTCSTAGICITVEGRADGIITIDGDATIDEIKTTNQDLATIEEDANRAYWGQAKCYAFMYAEKCALPSINVQLTYYQIDTDEIKRFNKTYTREELTEFYQNLLKEYSKWLNMQKTWEETRQESARNLKFPFPQYREGQHHLAAAVYKTIRGGKKLYCMAPTGIGKTMSTLFPAIKSIGEDLSQKVFYLTAKTTTRKAAEGAISIMKQQNLSLKSITLTAKDTICFLEERVCTPEACPYAKGYYNRARDAVFSIMQTESTLTRANIERLAKEFNLCPFELSLDLSLWCDVIICDYNHLFDPRVSLKRFFSDSPGPYVFLVDEAHNLVDRARSMYSASLVKSEILELKRAVGKDSPALFNALSGINNLLLSYRKEAEERDIITKTECPSELIDLLVPYTAICERWLKEHEHAACHDIVLNLYFRVQTFLKIATLYDDSYITYLRAYKSEVTVKLFCRNPSAFLKKSLDLGVGSILFSATLTPLSYYRDVLGGSESDFTYAVPSPFDPKNLCLIVTDYLSTKYKDREQTKKPISDAIFEMVSAKCGNYMAYFPSYQYLQMVAEIFVGDHPEIDLFCQSTEMGDEEKETFLGRFESNPQKTMLGFCVLGGAFSEGIDLKGDKLIGVAVVGVGLPQINAEQDLIRDYYQSEGKVGFDFAYRYPGMNKVMQAAGRVIRGHADRGIVLLLDDRYRLSMYQRLFPPHFRNQTHTRNLAEIKEAIRKFWE